MRYVKRWMYVGPAGKLAKLWSLTFMVWNDAGRRKFIPCFSLSISVFLLSASISIFRVFCWFLLLVFFFCIFLSVSAFLFPFLLSPFSVSPLSLSFFSFFRSFVFAFLFFSSPFFALSFSPSCFPSFLFSFSSPFFLSSSLSLVISLNSFSSVSYTHLTLPTTPYL